MAFDEYAGIITSFAMHHFTAAARFLRSALALWLATAALALHSQAASAVFVNIAPSSARPLAAALAAQGIGSEAIRDSSLRSFSAPLVVWDARASSGGDCVPAEIKPETADALGRFVQAGGSLLLGLDRNPASTPVRLSFLSPTMAWQTQLHATSRGGAEGGIRTGWEDPLFFSTTGAEMTLPYYYRIRPFHSAERGMARLDQFDRMMP